MYLESFIRKNPAKFVDTAWVNVDDLKSFLRAREVCVRVYLNSGRVNDAKAGTDAHQT